MLVRAKKGMLIRAKKDLRGVSNSYNTPERIEIKKGTLLVVPGEGTRFGDCFCKIREGKAIKHCRGYNEGEKREMTPENSSRDVIGLGEGYKTAPYSLGQIDTDFWEIENMSAQSVTLSLVVRVDVMDGTPVTDVEDMAKKEFLELMKDEDEYRAGISDISTL